jgi:hypothetical protein
MKKFYPILVLVFISITVNAQTPNWAWAKKAGNAGNDKGNITTTDDLGNIYVTGTYSSPSITFGAFTLTNSGVSDIYIVKFDANGNVLWALGVGGTGEEYGWGTTIDDFGNVYVTGSFASDSITFGSTTFINESSVGYKWDMFIVKYDANGNVLWAQCNGSVYDDYATRPATDAFGNVFVTGYFESPSVTFGTTTLTNTNAGYFDIFIVKYDASGNMLWAKSAGGSHWDEGTCITTDIFGNVYVAGIFYSPSLSFGADTLTNTFTFNSPDMFIVKYDNMGNILWAKGAGNSGSVLSHNITIDVSGNVYVIGAYGNYPINFGTIVLNNAGSDDIFIVKYDTTGNVLWANGTGSTGSDSGYGITTDAIGNVYGAGFFGGPFITFGGFTLTNTISTGNSADIFILKYDSSGNVLWAKGAGGNGHDFGSSITTDAADNAYITGHYNSTSLSFGVDTLINAGSYDMYISKIDPTIVGIEEKKAGNDINVYPNPSNGVFNFKDTKNIKQVEVYSLLGEQIVSQGNQKQINLSGFAKGIYYARINGEVVVKLVKE